MPWMFYKPKTFLIEIIIEHMRIFLLLHSPANPLRPVPVHLAVGDKMRPSGGAVVLAKGHGSVRQDRHAPGDAPSSLVSPALRPDGEQPVRQTGHAQLGQCRPHGEPHVRRPRLAGGPCRVEHLFGFFLRAVEQTYLEIRGREVRTHA